MMFKSFIYALKKFQFTLRTWKNATEISRAYGPASRKGPAIGPSVRVGAVWVIIAIIILSLAGIGVARFSKMRDLRQTEPNIVQTIKKINETSSKPERPTASLSAVMVPDDTSATIDTAARAEPLLPPVVKPVIKKYEYIPSTDTASFLVLVANKACRSMYVLQQQNSEWRVVREYDIAIGAQEGRKVTAGDKRTPEGLYCILNRKEKNELAEVYGPLTYVLDYPNEEDRRAGRTGQGIWIHGTAPDSLPFQTRGCLEMENKKLVELSSLLKKGTGTPVLIVSDPDLSDIASLPDYAQCRQRRETVLREGDVFTGQFREILTSWKTSWETKDISRYETFYDTSRFSGQGLRWSGWKERKLRTFEMYDTIAISIDKMKIVKEADNKLIVKFLQRYSTNLNSIENGKKMWFEKVNDFWKITGESTCSKEELVL